MTADGYLVVADNEQAVVKSPSAQTRCQAVWFRFMLQEASLCFGVPAASGKLHKFAPSPTRAWPPEAL